MRGRREEGGEEREKEIEAGERSEGEGEEVRRGILREERGEGGRTV